MFIRLENIWKNIDTKRVFLNRWAFRFLFLVYFFPFLSEGVSELRMGVKTEYTVNEIRLIPIRIVSVLILMTWFRSTYLFVYLFVYCNCFDPLLSLFFLSFVLHHWNVSNSSLCVFRPSLMCIILFTVSEMPFANVFINTQES